MLDQQRRHRMIDAFKESHGEETAMTLAEGLYSTDHATKADLEPLATKAEFTALGVRIDELDTRLTASIAQCATKADLALCATKADLALCATKADLTHFATKADLKGEMNRQLRWMITTMVAFLGATSAMYGIGTAFLVQAINA